MKKVLAAAALMAPRCVQAARRRKRCQRWTAPGRDGPPAMDTTAPADTTMPRDTAQTMSLRLVRCRLGAPRERSRGAPRIPGQPVGRIASRAASRTPSACRIRACQPRSVRAAWERYGFPPRQNRTAPVNVPG
jgi:hypothetical protein